MDNLRDLKEKLVDLIPAKNHKSIGTVFRTDESQYVYDTGTGKVFSCDNITYDLFEAIFLEKDIEDLCNTYSEECIKKEINNIIDEIQSENILQASYSEFARETDEELNAVYNYSLQSLILEVTQMCNYRCKYCVFHNYNEYYRDYSMRNMSWETAKTAIEYVSKHSGKKELSVSFYGGEPLINFEVMKKSIDYCEKLMPDKTLIFAFTTNLSLMDKEKADYFAKHNCYIMCSLDGPQYIHDAYRVGTRGEGTYNKTLLGLRTLLDAYGTKAVSNISFNVVVCPPYSRKKLNAIKDFFEELDWLPDGISIKYSYVESGSLREQDIDYTYFPKGEDIVNEIPPIDVWLTEELSKENTEKGILFSLARDALVRVHKRFLLDRPCEKIKRNGCCIPGGRRIYIDIDGNIALCERVGKCPFIGNVKTGINMEQVKKWYLEDYEKASIDQCKNCWAVNLCNMCYAACYREEGIDINVKNKLCQFQRDQLKGELIMYHQVLETHPELLKDMESIKVV